MPNYSGIPSEEDQFRAVRRKLRELKRRNARERGEKASPAAPEELFPGGPSEDTGDLRLARRRARKRREHLA